MRDRQRNFPNANSRARRLRRKPTPAENRLWKLLRSLKGFHFRRQTPVGPHVFAFSDLGRNLLIEVDGGIHELPEVMERDRMKSEWAQRQGFIVVRIPNDCVFGAGEHAVAMVLEAMRLVSSARKR